MGNIFPNQNLDPSDDSDVVQCGISNSTNECFFVSLKLREGFFGFLLVLSSPKASKFNIVVKHVYY